MLGSLWQSICARVHGCYDIGHTGRLREDSRIMEGRRRIIRPVSNQQDELLAGLAQFSRDRLACLATAEVGVQNGDVTPRLKP
jgi:hypothetical protein